MKRSIAAFLILCSVFGIRAQCRNFHLYRNEQGKQGVIDGRRNVFVPARYDTLIMRDTIWANWFGDFEKHAGLYVHIDGLTPMNRFGYLARQDGKWGFVAADGKTLIPAVYDTIWPCEITERYIVRRNRKYGMIDCRGFQELFPCDYDSIRCRKTDREFSYCSDNDSPYLLGVKVETWRDGRFESRDFPAEYTPLSPADWKSLLNP